MWLNETIMTHLSGYKWRGIVIRFVKTSEIKVSYSIITRKPVGSSVIIQTRCHIEQVCHIDAHDQSTCLFVSVETYYVFLAQWFRTNYCNHTGRKSVACSMARIVQYITYQYCTYLLYSLNFRFNSNNVLL